MPWTIENPPKPAINWSDDEKQRCVDAANAALAKNPKNEQGAIFACIAAAGKGKEQMADDSTPIKRTCQNCKLLPECPNPGEVCDKWKLALGSRPRADYQGAKDKERDMVLNANEFIIPFSKALRDDILIFPVGAFHRDGRKREFTREMGAEMVANYKANILERKNDGWLPINAEHMRQHGRLADIATLYQDDDGNVRGKPHDPDGKLGPFDYFSPEVRWQWTHPTTGKGYKNVLMGGGATNYPFFLGKMSLQSDEVAIAKSADAPMVWTGSGWEQFSDDEPNAVERIVKAVGDVIREAFGGGGSGNWAHKGTKGSRGGSAPGGGMVAIGAKAGTSRNDRIAMSQKARGEGGTQEYTKIPQSKDDEPSVYELSRKGVLAKWKYKDSTRDRIDGASMVIQGGNGDYYAYKGNATFKVKPVEMRSNGTIPKIKGVWQGSVDTDPADATFTHTTTFAAADTDQRILTGVVWQPDTPDLHGHAVGALDIEQGAHDFMSRLQLDAHHDRLVQSNEVQIVESWIQREPVTWKLELPDGGVRTTEVQPGTWCMSVKVLDDELWSEVLSGDITGFSPVGVALAQELKKNDDYGGAGSGNWAHKGTKGSRGGSAPGGGLVRLGAGAGTSRTDRIAMSQKARGVKVKGATSKAAKFDAKIARTRAEKAAAKKSAAQLRSKDEDTAIIAEYRKFKDDEFNPAYKARQEAGISNLRPTETTKGVPRMGKPGFDIIPLTSSEIALQGKFQKLVAQDKKMWPKFSAATQRNAARKGKRMQSKYAGKSTFTGKSFPAGTDIYYKKYKGRTLVAPVGELDR